MNYCRESENVAFEDMNNTQLEFIFCVYVHAFLPDEVW